jgi:hypothetical protein
MLAAGLPGADLPGQGGGVVGVQERDASGGEVGGGQLGFRAGRPSAGAVDP